MLTAAALGMCSYGIYSINWAVADLARGARLELWAELGLIVFGALLVLAAAFVRVRLPGGVAFAIGAMLGLQALAVHDAVHLGTSVATQIARAVVAITLAGLAAIGNLDRKRERVKSGS
jgi:fatty acid desaturase